MKCRPVISRNYLVLVLDRIPNMGVWDYPLPIDLTKRRVRYEIEAACKEFGCTMTEIKKVLAEADQEAERATSGEEQK